MKIAYFHCASGISGDMCLGALLHAGADFEQLKHQLALLPVKEYEIFYHPVLKNNISAGQFTVVSAKDQPHRQLKDIVDMIHDSSLPPEIQNKSLAVFYRLAEAEAKVHGTSIDKIHFHEVGAIDGIIDIVGTIICLSLLKIEQVISSPLPVGYGFISCAHGLLPLPAPATREILKGIPQYGIDVEGELVTPTGASLIATLAQSFGPFPKMLVDTVAYGAGTKEYTIPNLLAITIGRDNHIDGLFREEIDMIETPVDNMNPEYFSHLWETIFSLGALDLYLTSIYMKKGRPGTLLTVLCQPEHSEFIMATILQETSSLGVRIRKESRRCCPRRKVTVNTKFGQVGIKVAAINEMVNFAPEYEDCRQLALMHHVPLKEVYLEAIVAAQNDAKPKNI